MATIENALKRNVCIQSKSVVVSELRKMFRDPGTDISAVCASIEAGRFRSAVVLARAAGVPEGIVRIICCDAVCSEINHKRHLSAARLARKFGFAVKETISCHKAIGIRICRGQYREARAVCAEFEVEKDELERIIAFVAEKKGFGETRVREIRKRLGIHEDA
jgi:hypothetical protein